VIQLGMDAGKPQALAMGLVYFLTEMKKAPEEEFVKWASTVAIDTLRTGLDVIVYSEEDPFLNATVV